MCGSSVLSVIAQTNDGASYVCAWRQAMADSKDSKSESTPATGKGMRSESVTNSKATANKSTPPTADINKWCTAAWEGSLKVLEAEPKTNDLMWRGYVIPGTPPVAHGLFRCSDPSHPALAADPIDRKPYRLIPLSDITESADYSLPPIFFAAAFGRLEVVEHLIATAAVGEAAAAAQPIHFAHPINGSKPIKYSVKADGGASTAELVVPSEVARANGHDETANRLEASAAGSSPPHPPNPIRFAD